ncbi:hypothetical protein BTJ40_15215 [Microbulbifer sp. A4B17]|uniref:hypothetical protein n=1 Tax=Microbulbifer sp. A4B17 TaxID=359370 RepID=UPI000D52F029|nr:hypothetical protein [Microbulbifer sp. A4B17]AWF82068.1 hypothetical protein BTJ40_15215 [Microbulbifer sp. A4B17]
MIKRHPGTTFVFLALLTILVNGCSQIAPRYDAALYSGLTTVNVEIMEFFSSVSSGTDKNSYSTRDKKYHALIGKVDALAMQSKTRPVPESKMLSKINEYLESSGKDISFEQEPPSVASLEKISESLNMMRTEDEDKGLNTTAVSLFKNEIVISMDQALTYESFLNR